MIAELRVFVPVAFIQLADRRAVRLRETVDGITIHGESDGLIFAHHALQVQRSDVIMIIIGAAAMPAPLVQFADLIGDFAAIVLRVENRNAVHADGDGSAQKVIFDNRRCFCRDRFQWQTPGVVAGVRLRQRHLLLPGGDAHHHVVVRDSVRLDVKKVLVPFHIHLGCKGRERCRLCRGLAHTRLHAIGCY